MYKKVRVVVFAGTGIALAFTFIGNQKFWGASFIFLAFILYVLDNILFDKGDKPLFKKGQLVMVDHPRYKGPGVVQYDSGDRKRVVGVLLENNNIWE